MGVPCGFRMGIKIMLAQSQWEKSIAWVETLTLSILLEINWVHVANLKAVVGFSHFSTIKNNLPTICVIYFTLSLAYSLILRRQVETGKDW